MAYSAASHQGAIKMFWLQYSPDKSKTVCVCVGAEPGGPAGAELCEEAAGGSAEAAGTAGGGEKGGGCPTGEGREEE